MHGSEPLSGVLNPSYLKFSALLELKSYQYFAADSESQSFFFYSFVFVKLFRSMYRIMYIFYRNKGFEIDFLLI